MGFELIRRVRSRPPERAAGIPAIGRHGVRVGPGSRVGARVRYEAHVAKPVRAEALAQTVAALCRAQIRPS